MDVEKNTNPSDETSKPKPDAQKAQPNPEPHELPEAILERARQGDRSVLPQLERILDENPRLWQRCNNLVALTEQGWITKIAEKNLLLSQSIRRKLEQLKRDLAGPSPSPLEQVLAERIAVCWLEAHYAELKERTGDVGDGKVAAMQLKRLESANRRFLTATKALAQVRRLSAGLKIEIVHKDTVETPMGGRFTGDGADGVRDQVREAVASSMT